MDRRAWFLGTSAVAIALAAATGSLSWTAQAAESTATTATQALKLRGTVSLETRPRAIVFKAKDGKRWELTGPRANVLVEKLGLGRADAALEHPVKLAGTRAGRSPRGRPLFEVKSFSFRSTYTARTIARGMTWRKQVFPALFRARQTVNVAEIDVARVKADVDVVKSRERWGETPSTIGRRLGARICVNGAFFNTATYEPLNMLRVDGRTLGRNPDGYPRTTFGVDRRGLPHIETLRSNDAWPAARDALGLGPRLVLDGVARVNARAEQFGGVYVTGRHPRTAIGVRSNGVLVLVTVDGRTSAGAGMTLDELARLMAILGCDRAMNLDGGGSTSLWIAGRGVVNRPSDPTGERRVPTAITVDD